jgi:hypothetical protein
MINLYAIQKLGESRNLNVVFDGFYEKNLVIIGRGAHYKDIWFNPLTCTIFHINDFRELPPYAWNISPWAHRQLHLAKYDDARLVTWDRSELSIGGVKPGTITIFLSLIMNYVTPGKIIYLSGVEFSKISGHGHDDTTRSWRPEKDGLIGIHKRLKEKYDFRFLHDNPLLFKQRDFTIPLSEPEPGDILWMKQ